MRKSEEAHIHLLGKYKKKFLELVFKPNFMDTHLFAEDFAAVEMQKTKLLINKPFFVGFTILDLAKLHMYR